MKIIDWLLGSKCDACGQRTRSNKHLDHSSGAQNLHCDACHDKLVVERKRQDEQKRKEEEERKRQEVQKRKEEEARTMAESKARAPQARTLSRQLNDAAISAVRAGDNQTAMKKWVEAATADPTFSGPPFNMARFMLDKGARRPDELRVVEKYLDAAERNALKSNDDEDARILEQLPTLRGWLASRRKTIDI